MPSHTSALHHHSIRKRIYKKNEPFPHPEKLRRVFDRLIYVAVIFIPLLNIPQLFKIWYYKSAAGVSAISWFGFSIFAVIWTIYGILHDEKPIVYMHLLLILMQLSIAIGAVIYG
jgi:uncharacterized protein with PQ loop repeat